MRLDDSQRAILETAVEQGYFDVPRRTTIVDIADEHDVSDVEASQQLRAAIDTVLRDQLLDGPISSD